MNVNCEDPKDQLGMKCVFQWHLWAQRAGLLHLPNQTLGGGMPRLGGVILFSYSTQNLKNWDQFMATMGRCKETA